MNEALNSFNGTKNNLTSNCSLMAKRQLITSEDFEMLLQWLDQDRELAGQKYENIRQRLIRLFVCRSCFEPEELADETINRVTFKLPQLISSYVGEPVRYFYGVANNVHLEWLREEKKKRNLQIPDPSHDDDPDLDLEYDCLESCLSGLPEIHRELIVQYYTEEQRGKILTRKQLAERLGMTAGALHVKTCRIRAGLLKCIQKCVSVKKS